MSDSENTQQEIALSSTGRAWQGLVGNSLQME